VKSEVVRDADGEDDVFLLDEDVGEEVTEVSEVGEDELGVLLVEEGDADVGVLDGLELIEGLDDGDEEGVTIADVLDGADDPVPPNKPVAPPVICEMKEETSSEESFF